MQPFDARANTFKIDVTATSSISKSIEAARNIRVYNAGAYNAYISVGNGTQTATVPATTAVKTCTPIPAGADLVLSMESLLGGSGLQIAAICDTGLSTTLFVSTGEGI